MFKKITTMKAQGITCEGGREYVSYGVTESGQFQGIKYTDLNLEDEINAPLLWGLISEEHHTDFELSLMTVNRDILPHTDSNTKTVINWYLETGGYTTSFCTPRSGATKFKLPTQTDGLAYHFKDVVMGESFVAEPNSLYVLDVTKLHCVHSGEGKRVALNLATKLPYEQVISILKAKEEREDGAYNITNT